jgi:hypothetical protein
MADISITSLARTPILVEGERATYNVSENPFLLRLMSSMK